jgi:diacylglycerol kinase (ATP)
MNARSTGPTSGSVRPGEKPVGFVRLYKAFGNTAKGLAGCWREEAAFRQECFLTLILVPAAFWLGRTGVERVLLIGPLFLILIVELLNSAVEAAIDRIGTERHVLSGLAKDLGSAAVFVAFLLLGLSWALILIDQF